MKEYKLAVFIGRFQPFHKAHQEVVKHGLSIADEVLILVGSSNCAPDTKNPWTFEQRVKMIQGCFPNLSPISFEPVRDYFYSDNVWVSAVQAKVAKYAPEGSSVVLLGNFKDSSSYYFKLFPQWDFIPVKTTSSMDATYIRDELFSTANILHNSLPESVSSFLTVYVYDANPKGWVNTPGQPSLTPAMSDRMAEHEQLKSYKQSWEAAPFPVTFVTADAVVTCSGHILLVKRKFNPGRGLYALPGGFIKQSELIQDAAVRELKEETGIRVDKIILHSSIRDSHVFDHPNRSLRGRTITHAFHIKLKDGILPEVKGSDDAAKAEWFSMNDFFMMEDKMFEDHHAIVNYFVNRG